MMDKVVPDGNANMKEILIQRDLDRKAKIKNLKEEKEAAAPDHAKVFEETFEDHTKQILENIKLLELGNVEQKTIPDYLDKISKNIQNLNRYLSVSSSFLTNYTVGKSMKTIEDLDGKIKQLETDLLPKKKFGFKTRKPKLIEKTDKELETKKSDEVDASVGKKMSYVSKSLGFSDVKDKILKLDRESISKQDLELKNLDNCTVHLHGNPSTTHISNATRCTILSGPASTSVFVENCQECVFVIACQQLRIHSTTKSKFYIHVTSRAIIEDSTNVEFAPYNLTYEEITKDFEVSGLNVSQNNWNLIDDFNWLASDAASPNWRVIKEEERIKSWPL
ncbi:tubulin-specific chaperone C-like isoform X1 [Macrosteles quadrilineatus]|uniref:tubulin-specific chaperone C-like isoform X1 n=1 Tax=Macrosteles quadrilineatus TaxID=74068 RepID=UPI0023E23C3C|nr:tubulin-specific chaperone C-like isoform X1 [Macrosteles quadrilineatus]XP_054264908.1 tubulin-specific chaperone C-like isoform X1 [Macrosteles quadrilineatus]